MAEEKPRKSNILQNPSDQTSQPPTETTEKTAININSTKSPSFSSLLARLRTSGLRTLVDLGAETLFTENPEQSLAFYLHVKGVEAEKLTEKVRISYLFTPSQKKSLLRSAGLMRNLEIAESNQSRLLQEASLKPEIEIVKYIQEEVQPAKNQVILAPQEQIISLSLDELKVQIAQNPIANFTKNYLKDYAKNKLTNIAKNAAKKVAEKEVAKKAVEVGVRLGARLALRETISNIAAAVGAVTGPLAPLVMLALKALSYLFTELLIKIVSKIKKNSKEIASVGIGLLAAGLVFTSPTIATVGLVGVGLGALGGGLQTAVSSFTQIVIKTVTLLTTTLIATLVTAGVVALAFTLVFSVIAFLVINQSAYIVPPSLTTLISESPYFSIVKTAESANPPKSADVRQTYENSVLAQTDGLTITYRITITPTQGSLTNINFQSDCKVIKDGPSPNCPSEENIATGSGQLVTPPSFPPPSPDLISPSDPFIITYTQTFSGDDFADSLIFDTFTVTAEATDGTRTTAGGSASIIIGTPPTDCFEIVGSWPASYETNLLSAITNLRANYPTYVTQLCSGGNIPICYEPVDPGWWGYHAHESTCDIILYKGGLSTVSNTTYILAHEAGHHLARIMPQLYSRYVNTPGILQELPLCSYPATSALSEGFAEGIALYVSLPSYWAARCSTGNTYQSLYPAHYNFVDRFIF
jgi:hypothetical protein